MATPQITLIDYTDKSIVLRVEPDQFAEYFKPYSDYLTNFSGKWIGPLDYPSKMQPSGQKKGGWIFPKKNEAQVRQALMEIQSGRVQAQSQAVKTYSRPANAPLPTQNIISLLQQQSMQTQNPSASPAQRPMPQFAMQPTSSSPLLIVENGPAKVMSGPTFTLPPSGPTLDISSKIPPGYQQITCIVLKPETGKSLTLMYSGQRIPIQVESVEEHNGVTDIGIIKLPDGQKSPIKLENGRWILPGFPGEHQITS